MNNTTFLATTPHTQDAQNITPLPLSEPTFSLYNRCTMTGKPSDHLTLTEFVQGVSDGHWRPDVEACRQALKAEGKKAYDALRETEVPAVTLSAQLKTRKRGTTLEQKGAVHSGLLQLDFDAKDHPDMTVEEIRQLVWSAPFVAACFLSLSGHGIKAIGLCPASFETHAGSWLAADAYFKERGLTLDRSTKDPCRLCFVSYDPQAFEWDEATEIVPLPVPPPAPREGGSDGTEDPEHVRRKLSELAEKKGVYQDRNTWLHICACTKDAVGADAAGEIVDEYFPPLEPHHESASDVMDSLPYGTWATLWKYGVDPTDYLKLLPDLGPLDDEEGGTSKPSLRERAYALRFDPAETPPPDETCMLIGDVPIAARGNLTVPQGKSKVGKSAVISAVLGAAHRGDVSATGDTLCVEWQGESTGAIIHLDTEQSRADWHSLVCRGIIRSGLPETSPRLVSLPLVMFSRSERLDILKQTLEFERRKQGGIDLVLIDGVADLCKSPNDEAEALELVSQLHALAQEFHCPVFCVLHENPSSEAGKTRGHLGSELNRKAFANLRIDKDTETSVSTIYGTDMRKRDIPKDHGFCFAWNDAAKMHTFQGRAAGLKQARQKNNTVESSRTEWQKIFDAAKIGTNGECPELTPKRAVEVDRDMNGTEKTVTLVAMKKRMQRAKSLGVLRKTGAGAWTLNPSGQSGQNGDI